METKHEQKAAKRIARTLGISVFVFMCAVSAVAFATNEDLTTVDYVLIVGAPFVLSALAYFVGLHHDATASE